MRGFITGTWSFSTEPAPPCSAAALMQVAAAVHGGRLYNSYTRLHSCMLVGAAAHDGRIFTAIIPATVTLGTTDEENEERLQTAQWPLFSAAHLHNSVSTSGRKARLGREGTVEARAAAVMCVRSVSEKL